MNSTFTRHLIFVRSVKPPLEENPLSLLWQAINVEEFLEGINLPMTEGFLEEVQEPSPPPQEEESSWVWPTPTSPPWCPLSPSVELPLASPHLWAQRGQP